MQLLLVLAILAAFILSESCPSRPVSDAGVRLLIAAAGMTCVALFAAVSAALTAKRLRGNPNRSGAVLRLFRRLRQVHLALWLTVAGGILYRLGWAQLVRFNWHLDRMVLIDELLILLPVVLPLVLSWAAFYEVDRAVRAGLIGGGPTPAIFTRREYVALHLRHYLGILLLPVLTLLTVRDLVELLVPDVLKPTCAPLIHLGLFALALLLFPLLLRCVWKTSPLEPGPLRSRLRAAAQRAGFTVRDVLVWQTGGMVVNAAVAGFIAPLRYVFLTDGLLARLTDEEVEAVFGHEVGHVRHRHLLLRMAAVMAPLSLCLLVDRAFPEAVGRMQDWLAGGGLGLQVPVGLLTLAAMAVYILLVFGVYSRLLEAQADLFGCHTLASEGDACPVGAFTSALEKLAVAGGVGRRVGSWQHGSIARRVDFLNQVAGDPRLGARLQRRVDLLSCLMISAVLSPLVYLLLAG